MNRSYRCDCVDGYLGPNCEKVDHCHSSPCRHGGTCVPQESGYKCLCDIEFQGPDCQIETPCNRHGKRCYNDGVCKLRLAVGDEWDLPVDKANHQEGEFYCECQPGYSGARCQHFDPCSSGNTCVNGGTCQVITAVLLESIISLPCDRIIAIVMQVYDQGVTDLTPGLLCKYL